MTEKKVILDKDKLKKTINRMVDEILERTESLGRFIYRRSSDKRSVYCKADCG